jgi:acyl-CoA synthetase (AMP-forming)/AMP-acid ligase II
MVEINPPMPEVAPQETIVEMIRARAQEHPEKEALVCGDTRLTWGAFDVRVNRVANALIARGIGRGKVVFGFQFPDSLRVLEPLGQR